MKTLFSILVFLIASNVVLSQTSSVVTINTTGNRNKQIVVDGKYYAINNTTGTTVTPIVINDLSAGQHTLELVRNNQNNSAKSSFTLRDGYDLTITVSSNGSISSSETRVARTGNNSNAQLSVTAFNKLYTQTKNKTSSAARATFLESEFNTSKKQLTSKQASQLIQLVSTESLRLKLAKQSFTRVSDQQNFSLVTNLLSSTANRNELNTYIASLPATGTNEDVTDVNTTAPIDDVKFREIYNEVLAEPAISDRAYYLNNYFSRDFNYYSSAQAKQLIELIQGEQDRFSAAKTAYRGVTDKENYTVVYPLLTTLSNRSELVAYINNYDNSNPRPAMTAANFDKLYKSAYALNSSTARYTSINKAFTTSGNYFTVAQAKKLISLVSSEASRLELSKAAYKVLVDRANYTQFNDFLSSSTNRNALISYVNNYNGVSTGSSLAMSETDYNKLYQSVNSSWSSSSKFNLVSEAFKTSTNYFTTAQAKQLLTMISSENDKLSLAKNSYDNIVDLANYNQLYDLFTSTASKNDLASFVTSMQSGGTTTVKIPMSETEFKSLSTELKLTFGLGAKYSTLTSIFNKETNYFTVDQTKQLIQMVSSESNRLELAKLSYNNITDPANFSQIYDIFSSQANKNALMAYVNSSVSAN